MEDILRLAEDVSNLVMDLGPFGLTDEDEVKKHRRIGYMRHINGCPNQMAVKKRPSILRNCLQYWIRRTQSIKESLIYVKESIRSRK